MSRKRAFSEVDPSGAGIEPAPYSQVGRVTHNARVDSFSVAERLALGNVGTYYNQSVVADRMFNIDKPELCLQRVGRTEEFRTGGRVGFHAVVFSSMNALREKSDQPKHAIVKKYRLEGIAQSTVKFHGDKANTEILSLVTGGTHSLWNTGTERISAGDEVWWDIPDRDEKGNAYGYTPRKDAPQGKIPACVIKPYRPDVHGPDAVKQLDYVRNAGYKNTDGENFLDRTDMSKYGHLAHVFDCMVRLIALGTNIEEIALGTNNEKEKKGFQLNVDAEKTLKCLNDKNLRKEILEFLVDSKTKTQEFNDSAFSKDYGNIFSQTVNCFAEHINYIACRKFGKATSNCDPGNMFDVVLGTYRFS